MTEGHLREVVILTNGGMLIQSALSSKSSHPREMRVTQDSDFRIGRLDFPLPDRSPFYIDANHVKLQARTPQKSNISVNVLTPTTPSLRRSSRSR